ncbi:hypothetical protein H0X10_03835, partial [Candidatus Saccharibacteria bacterium]|nr:hypothetical protein [Candidatus Saccharibacteria bacterium]
MKKGWTFWKKLKFAAIYAWRPALLVGFMGAFLYYLLWFRLGSLTPGLSSSEA